VLGLLEVAQTKIEEGEQQNGILKDELHTA